MFKSNARRGVLVALLAAGSIGMSGAAANAATMATYQLSTKEQRSACGSFGGTIIFGDGSGSIDCHSGIATYPVAS
jgi:hypothetical protein